MRAYITSGLNKDAHRIMKETGISWGLSFGVALKVQHIDLDLVGLCSNSMLMKKTQDRMRSINWLLTYLR
jgi:hypothetical protein